MNNGSPWVSIFSRFTSEALLFEALAIFTLSAVYTAFWLLRKRKYGVAHQEVPAGVVKYYLNELIVDAEQIRAQLFGLLAGQGIAPTPLAGVTLGTSTQPGIAAQPSVQGNPAATQSLGILESKIAEQAKQIEMFIAEKAKVEKELTEVKAAQTAGAASGGDAVVLTKLQEKIGQLEGKLGEYSVIEDDLANLKRLQQENAALKAQLAGKAASPTPAATTTAPTPAPTPAAATVTDLASEAAAVEAETAASLAAMEAALETSTPAEGAVTTPALETPAPPPAQAVKTTPPETATTGAASADFEGLVDQVEASLAQPAEASIPTTASAPSTTATAPATIEKTDADLVAEFEKMLNG
jgi:chaperonin cofactor prefoldin